MKRLFLPLAVLIAAVAIHLLFRAARRDPSAVDERYPGASRDRLPAEHREGQASGARTARTAPSVPARHTASAPSFSPSASAPEPGSLPTDPEDPDYDPAVLMRALLMSPVVLFEREKRDPIWAPAVESRIRDTLRHDFSACFPNREPTVQQECRSSTCIVTLHIPESYSAADKELADGMAIARDRRDLDQYDAQMKAGRRRIFDMFQQTPELPKMEPFAADLKDCYARISESSKH